MASKYTQLYFHFVWTTAGRQPFISEEVEVHLYRYLRHKCHTMGVFVYALNGMPDHVHLACTLPTSMAIADFVETIKGSSAHFINHLPGVKHQLYWQSGYGALTFARRDLQRIVSYIDHQKSHHRNKKLSPEMERCTE
jgi:REP element-mobilizing transposase RayT